MARSSIRPALSLFCASGYNACREDCENLSDRFCLISGLPPREIKADVNPGPEAFMTPRIDRSGPVPLQKQLYSALKDWFAADFSPEDLLPSELAIARQFGVSKGTVRIALENMVKEQLILRIPGRGTFLTPQFKIKLKKYSIGVILSDADFFTDTIWEYEWINHLEILNGIVAANLPFNLSTEFVSEAYFAADDNIKYDGFILWPYLKDGLRERLDKPHVNLEYKIDLRDGFRKIAMDAASRNYRKIAYIGFTSGGRVEEINRILNQQDCSTIPDERIFECGGTEAEAARSCIELMRRYPDVDALICSTDIRAFGVLRHLHSQGIPVPGRVAVYGFDGTRDNQNISPPLTTCRFDWQYPGLFAVKQIRKLLDGHPLDSFRPAQGTLVLRESTPH